MAWGHISLGLVGELVSATTRPPGKIPSDERINMLPPISDSSAGGVTGGAARTCVCLCVGVLLLLSFMLFWVKWVGGLVGWCCRVFCTSGLVSDLR